jgi:hypothetical protein
VQPYIRPDRLKGIQYLSHVKIKDVWKDGWKTSLAKYTRRRKKAREWGDIKIYPREIESKPLGK